MLRTSFVVVALLGFLACTDKSAPPEGQWRPSGIDAGVFGGSPLTEQGLAHKADADRRRLEKIQLGFVREPEQKCVADADCVLTPRFCCGCTANGAMVGVHKDKLQEVLYRRVVACKEYVCPQAMSTDPSCEAKKAACRGGVCVADVPAGATGKQQGIGVETIPDDAPTQPPTPTAPAPATTPPASAPKPTQPG